jgi:hypothetical protein
MSEPDNAATQLATRINTEIVLTRPPTTVALAALSGCIAFQLVAMTRHLPADHAADVVRVYLDLLRNQVANERTAVPPARPSINWNGA